MVYRLGGCILELSDEKILLKSKLFYHYFEPIAKKLSEINYAIVKGEPLSYYAYGEFGKRYFNDIDLLVSKDDLKFVRIIMALYLPFAIKTICPM